MHMVSVIGFRVCDCVNLPKSALSLAHLQHRPPNTSTLRTMRKTSRAPQNSELHDTCLKLSKTLGNEVILMKTEAACPLIDFSVQGSRLCSVQGPFIFPELYFWLARNEGMDPHSNPNIMPTRIALATVFSMPSLAANMKQGTL